jgi:hypothetical protein
MSRRTPLHGARLLFLLSACSSTSDSPPAPDEAAMSRNCQNDGYQPGTTEYERCMTRLRAGTGGAIQMLRVPNTTMPLPSPGPR